MPRKPEVDAHLLGVLVDRLRGGIMSDVEAINFAADLVRSGRVNNSSQDVFELLAKRLQEIKLREESPNVRDD